jgi:hypothetical protein
VLLVQSGAGVNDPGTATEAIRLAGTYAQVIPSDTRIQQAVAKALKISQDDVAIAVTAVNPSSTALIRVTYQAGDPELAVRGANAVARSVSGVPPASPSIASGLTVITSIPTSASSSTRGTASAVPVGGLLGLGLSIVILIAWERSDARVEDEQTLAHEVNCPASRLERLTAPSARVLVERWAELTGHGRSRIALIGTVAGHAAEVASVASVLALRAGGGRLSVDVLAGSRLELGPASADVTLVSGGAPGPAESGETAARSCDVTVVVCLAETKVSDLRASLNVLEDFGIQPVWGLLVDRRRRSVGEAVPVAPVGGNRHSPPLSGPSDDDKSMPVATPPTR